MNFSRSGRPIIQAEQKNQVAANQLAIMESARAARKQLMKEQLLPQLQANPQLMDMIPTVLQTKEDMDILNELFSEMNTGRGGKRRTKRRRTLKKRTLRRRTLKKRRRY